MKKFFGIFMLTVFVFGYAQAQDRATNIKKWQKSEAPEFTRGPWIESTNSITEGFEGATFPPAGWAKLTPDGGTGWASLAIGTTPLPGWNGGTNINRPGGSGTGTAYFTYTLGGAAANDSWLIAPQLLNVQNGDSLKFWMRKFGSYIDKLEIKISTTTNTSTADFTITAATLNFTAADSGWVSYGWNIGSLVPANSNIYIALRAVIADNFNDGAAFIVDDFMAGNGVVPVEFATFSAASVGSDIQLNWSTASETNNKGFSVERKAGSGEFVSIGFIDGSGTTTLVKEYSFIDKGVEVGTYTYRLKQVDFDGTSDYSKAIEVDVTAPNTFALSQNFPNPFNPSTKINFSLATDAKVTLSVYNVLGQEVATLVNGTMSAGVHSVDFDASSLVSGLYIAKITATGATQNFTSNIKMMLNK
ncbi:MAG: T9SS type A sorting domain-containing protein [Ignavibacteriales bacterium]|nr:T9SS type A sorting domain-containing protein [Ignavibacteriales bacterium]